MKKIMTIVGTRPELIKMSRVLFELDKHVHHLFVHTGQNYDYELNQIFFEDLGIRKPDYFLDIAAENSAKTIANVIQRSDELFEKEKPDAILFYGDTNSCLAVIAAKRRKIPIFHMEAGNRSFDQRVPEELNRKIVDHLSDINFVLTEHARRYLIAEGIKPETIIKTGSHMREVINFYSKKINTSNILNLLNLTPKQYFIVSAHREENVDCEVNLVNLLDTLNAIADTYKFPVIVSTHPRTKNRLNNLNNIQLNSKIKFLKPFSFTDYIKLQIDSHCIISDSGSLTEEASILNLPAINIRNSHERPEGMDGGILIMTGLKKENVLDAIKVVVNHHERSDLINTVPDFQSENVSKKILKVVMSYINYINRTVWYKNLD